MFAFEERLVEIGDRLKTFVDGVGTLTDIEDAPRQALIDALAELAETESAYESDRASLLAALKTFAKETTETPAVSNATQHAAQQAFAPLAERTKGLIKQIDLLYKLAARAAQLAQDLADHEPVGANSFARNAKTLSRRLKPLDAERKNAVEQLKLAVYFHRQILWLQERFPDAEFVAVPGLCKAVTRAEIAAADWSLTPGRYVGVAPPEVDEDFDFEQTLRDIHVELADLNREAAELAARIQVNLEDIL